MQTATFISSCLTFEKLKAYSENKVSKQESKLLYMHISSCELCSCAVNGYAAIPFSLTDIDLLNKKINVKSNATAAKSLTAAQVFIAIVSVLSVIGVYSLSDVLSKSNKQKVVNTNQFNINNEKSIGKENSTFSINKEKQEEPIQLWNNNNLQNNNSVSIKQEHESFDEMIPKEITLPENVEKNEMAEDYKYNSAIHYIYDLKITEYENLYFNKSNSSFEYQNYTPSFKENEASIIDLYNAEEEKTEAHKILRQGLYCFNKSNFKEALYNFNALLENNNIDINANFYAALCYYNIGKTNKAMHLFSKVLDNINNTFHPEAKWNLALCYIKQGDKENARALLGKIVNEKGFYAEKAKNKLNEL